MTDGAGSVGTELEGFTHFSFNAGDIRLEVYYAGEAPHRPLIVMPEIAGFSPGLVLFARRLIAEEFQIYVPWLFASLGVRRPRVMRELNVSDEDIAQARARLERGEARLFAVRCRADRISPAEKLLRLREEFPFGLTTREYGTDVCRNVLGERPHALFMKEPRIAPDAAPDHWSRSAFTDLVHFFRQHLAPPSR